jgi:hypothetical protein
MAIVHYTARAKDSRTLELPEEAQALGLQTGDEVHVFVNRNEDLVHFGINPHRVCGA